VISIGEIVADSDMIAPQAFLVQRSIGQFVAGGFYNTTLQIPAYGCVQMASDREVEMLQPADRIHEVKAFWWTSPLYTTREIAAVLPEVIPLTQQNNTTLALAYAPPSGFLLYKNGIMLTLGADYFWTAGGATIQLATPSLPSDVYQVVADTSSAVPAVSDVLEYGNYHFRVLQVYHDPGSGYWKALATRMEAS
jgi:hypothetical protein